ncbi:Uncharacterized protein APZ42_009124 [Daphnia magna]|uniref:Uncharacterized protein n=1 Tax=Daphnia magna TaxID=35525 RepID=A0A164E790_9CRUS|nr:Uncharacterized protein APZ42_009124 [Daphnia magna]
MDFISIRLVEVGLTKFTFQLTPKLKLSRSHTHHFIIRRKPQFS